MSTRHRSRAIASRLGTLAALLILEAAGCDAPGPTARPVVAPVGANSLTEAAPVDRGRMIYLRGESPSGRAIAAQIGSSPQLPATTLACVQCHGADGRGRPEGGVTPSDITWDNLARPYGVTHPDGRRHPAYTPALFGRAVTMGWDPAGQTLSVAMPRYQLAPEDLSDLIAYIRQIDRVSVPGVSESSIRIGIALPPDSPGAPRPDVVFRTISAYLETINRSGGIYRRSLMPIILTPTRHDEPEVFAVIGGFTPDGDVSSGQAGMAQAPSVCIYPPPHLARPINRPESFALISGHAGQTRSLARFVTDQRIGFDSGIAVVHGSGVESRALAQEVAGQLRRAGAKHLVVETLPSTGDSPSELAGRLTAQGLGAILLIGPADRIVIGALVPMLAAGSKHVTILVPAVLADPWLSAPPSTLASRLFIACPMPSWRAAEAAAALTAAKVLVEGLKGAGRSLDREAFIKALERVSTTASNQATSTSFGPGRRIGARGAMILRLAQDGVAYEIITPRIDTGSSSDDWPEESHRPGS
jgi:ABC-type branched-subunit amino acid transport system substrate-binding protein